MPAIESINEPPVDTAPLQPPPAMAYYEGELLNIFFHPLIARPEIAFSGSMKNHFLEWFVSVDEFKKIIFELYLKGYVLVDIGDFYDVTYVNGIKNVVVKKMLIPEGKKPMILSVDDLNYYEYMRKGGTVHKLVLDKNGEIAAWTGNANSGAVNSGELTYDQDIVTVLEDFIRQYPDFSVRGARGIIALTGYEGVLGYRTHKLYAPEYREEAEQATAVVNKLKKMGWRFASHSWGHSDMSAISMENFIKDANRWDKEVRPITGDTDLYIYPLGAAVEAQEEKHKALRDRNFNLFFGVGYGYTVRPGPGYIYFTRRNIDGYYFRDFKNSPDKLFDFDLVIDKKFRKTG